MPEYIIALGSAMWLGILTSISPCPLATNIAAISYIGKNIGKTSSALFSGLFYTLGRTLTYCVLGLILVSSAQAVPRISLFLQSKMKIVMGPFLIVIGIILLDFIKFSFAGLMVSQRRQEQLARSGMWGAFALGVVFALSFCPVSAALFFGSTFGLAVAHSSRVIIPSVYGIGTAAPVVAFALIIVFAAHSVGTVFKKVSIFEKWSRRISGIIFILAGAYLILTVNFHLFQG
ncbi:MAG: sulfite exporter TauE/SafE family protein [Chitinivibrionales bacterium]|nr:sulfite exporter TauE/SafE family protein [Chitinivibrionales bacterium]